MQELEVNFKVQMFIPGSNGIPGWISHQKNGSKITMRLPRYWYENDDFLGFALCSLHVPLDIEEENRSLKCKLNFNNRAFLLVDDFWSKRNCESCRDGDESNQVWLIYYPKSKIPKKYHSNEYRTLNTSFSEYFGTEPVKVERCGFHFIYAQDDYG